MENEKLEDVMGHTDKGALLRQGSDEDEGAPGTVRGTVQYTVEETLDLTATEGAIKAGWTPERFAKAFAADEFTAECGEITHKPTGDVIATYEPQLNLHGEAELSYDGTEELLSVEEPTT